MPRAYTNEDIVVLLRRLADDIDEPGADDWDAEGLLSVIRARLHEPPALRTHYHVATYVYARPAATRGHHGSPYATEDAALQSCADLGRAFPRSHATYWRCISADCQYA